MTSWRDRGYVRDSEDEEDTVSLESTSQFRVTRILRTVETSQRQTPSQAVKNTGPSLNNKQRNGTETPKNVISTAEASPATLKQVLDGSSSPRETNLVYHSSQSSLTSLSDRGTPELEDDILKTLPGHGLTPTAHVTGVRTVSDGLIGTSATAERLHLGSIGSALLSPTSEALFAHSLATRNLRARKAIQLHPYVLESERYKQQLQSRGLQPVLVRRESQAPAVHQTEDGEYSVAEESQPLDANGPTPRSSPPRLAASSSGRRERHRRNIIMSSSPAPNSDEDELPSLEDLLRPNKRRRLNQETPRPTTRNAMSRNSGSVMARHLDITDGAADMWVVPLSPHAVSQELRFTATTEAAQPRFKTPKPPDFLRKQSYFVDANDRRNVKQAVNPTPKHSRLARRVASSDVADRHTNVIEVSDDSPSDSHSSSDESSQEREVLEVKKRIRGVLPRSWVRLDLQRHNQRPRQKSNKQHAVHSAGDAATRGIARPAMRRCSPGSPRANSLLDDIATPDDSDYPRESTIQEVHQVADESLSRNAFDEMMPIGSLLEDPGPSMELEDFDFMIQGDSRRQTMMGSTKGRKRQLKIKDSFNSVSKRIKGSASGKNRYSAGAHRHRGARSSAGSKRREQRQSAVHLGILDMISEDSPDQHVPNFLKVATRQAKRLPKLGRQSPSRKYIRLSTRQDTTEANITLENWRTGKIKPKKVPRPPLRREPLSHTGGNTQRQSGSNPVWSVSGMARVAGDNRSPPGVKPGKNHPLRRLLNSVYRPQQGFRPGQLETLESKHGNISRTATFQAALKAVNQTYIQAKVVTGLNNPEVANFIGTQSVHHRIINEEDARARHVDPELVVPKQAHPRRRKLISKRLDVGTREYLQAEDPVSPIPVVDEVVFTVQQDPRPSLIGLLPSGSKYPSYFGVTPLTLGTFFNESTFVGSGEFSKCLYMNHRDFDQSTGYHIVVFGQKRCVWSTWSEQMAADVSQLVGDFKEILEPFALEVQEKDAYSRGLEDIRSGTSDLRQLAAANIQFLSFSDPIDRSSFVSRMCVLLEPSVVATIHSINHAPPQSPLAECLTRALSVELGLCCQLSAILRQISDSTPGKVEDVARMMRMVAEAIIAHVLKAGTSILRDFLEDNHRHAIREKGIGENSPLVEALVIVRHALEVAAIPELTIWTIFNQLAHRRIEGTSQVGSFEQAWADLFTLLPFQEVDASGTFRVGSRFTNTSDDWSFIKVALKQILQMYDMSTSGQQVAMNEYIRTLMRRCHRLIRVWGWKRCDSIIAVVFDFFARRKLSSLHNEDLHGSPAFLTRLNEAPTLETAPDDKSYHLFLKLLASALQILEQSLPPKKLTNVIWRCIPNHGRMYRKEDDLRHEDLDALRNQFDLLCTLYWICPSDSRSKLLDGIRSLVDHKVSHREACRLDIIAWTNLVRYHLGSNNDLVQLQSFSQWFKEILQQTIEQFQLARTEMELDYDRLQPSERNEATNKLVQTTISRNQRQILATLGDAVSAMTTVVKVSKSQAQFHEFLSASGFDQVFLLLNSRESGVDKALSDALSVYQKFLLLPKSSNQVSQLCDESQDYGEWPEENLPIDFICDPVFQVLSNVFGSDKMRDDSLTAKIVETWVDIAWAKVSRGEEEWSSFLDTYGEKSWERLGDTRQTHRFTSYFCCLVIEHDKTVLSDNRQRFLTTWLASLLERESTLKFQHSLTTAILNALPDDVLLRNLPFHKGHGDQYVVKYTELRDRRLSLISCVLANMRESYEYARMTSATAQSGIRQEYAVYLKEMMSTMKRSYNELQQGDQIRGSYVDFVQRVVESLQQYVADICPVDRFFTDSNAFPLPANDPNYVVGKLKGYGTKLGDSKSIKMLAIFFQNISERAAADSQQGYLVGQLHAAMEDGFEGRGQTLSLRSVLLQAIFPAYMKAMISTSCGWMFALPVLRATLHSVKNMQFWFDIMDPPGAASVSNMMTTTLATLQGAVGLLIDHSGLMDQAHIQHVLELVFQVVTASLSTLDYFRRHGINCSAIKSIRFFRAFSIFCAQILFSRPATVNPERDQDPTTFPQQYEDIRDYCSKELEQMLKSNWSRQGDHYFIQQRGGTRREVSIESEILIMDKDKLIDSIADFHNVLARMQDLL